VVIRMLEPRCSLSYVYSDGNPVVDVDEFVMAGRLLALSSRHRPPLHAAAAGRSDNLIAICAIFR
jgi:hypothetical protein